MDLRAGQCDSHGLAGSCLRFSAEGPSGHNLDRRGNYLRSWGQGAISDPHGFYIKNDIAYLTDRDDHVVLKYTLDGKPLRLIGERGQASDTGCETDGGRVPQAAGPFNKPTEMVPGPNGDLYVTDGYRHARVHRFSSDGRLISSWGEPGKKEPGEFHLPHSLWIDEQGTIYVCDRENTCSKAAMHPVTGGSPEIRLRQTPSRPIFRERR